MHGVCHDTPQNSTLQRQNCCLYRVYTTTVHCTLPRSRNQVAYQNITQAHLSLTEFGIIIRQFESAVNKKVMELFSNILLYIPYVSREIPTLFHGQGFHVGNEH